MRILPENLAAQLEDSWRFFVHLAVVLVPLFVGGSFLVGLAEAYFPPERIESMLRRYDEGSGNVLAAGFGAVTPFCSCSTVPVLAGMLRAGAPLGLAFSFLLASPLVNEIAVVLLLGIFGPQVTVIYVVATFGAAVIGGLVIGRLPLSDRLKDLGPATDGAAVSPDGGTIDCSSCGGVAARPTHRAKVSGAAAGAWSFLGETLPYLLVGMTVGALIHGAVPAGLVEETLGPGNPLAVTIAVLAGAPIYVSMSGMLPIAASLAESGVPLGTVLAFVIGGAGVSLPNLALLNKLFDRSLLAVYAGTVVTIGVVVGTLFNAFLA